MSDGDNDDSAQVNEGDLEEDRLGFLRRRSALAAGIVLVVVVAFGCWLAYGAFQARSNLEAARRYGIPSAGTTMHAFTLAHRSELDAFRAQVEAMGTDTTFLVDTYDIPSGIENAVAAAGAGIGAVRLDSGDVADEARKARKQLDALGATGCKIVVSGDLDEYRVEAMADAPVDRYMFGTRLVTGSGAPTAELPADHDPAALEAITVAISDDEGIDFVTPAIVSDDGEAVLWQVIPTTGPQDRATGDTVNRLRDEVLPGPEAQLGSEVAVTGAVAVSLDFSSYLSSRYPYFFGAVLLLSFLLLMAVFRSVLVPLKAVLMNLLSIGASYGVVVALFQWGWLSTITGVQPAPIEPWAPMMLFAIVFGLSMDYEVFLLSRVREEWHRTGDSRTSVADGLAATAKVITAAAAIMVVVFGAFVLEPDRIVKLMGTGLAVAILLDATIVRMILVPATMELLGDRNWWLPRWLDRVLPDIDVEGHTDR